MTCRLDWDNGQFVALKVNLRMGFHESRKARGKAVRQARRVFLRQLKTELANFANNSARRNGAKVD